jgi:endonuclease G
MLAFLLFAFFQPLLAQPDRFGLPACSAPDRELATRTAFVLCYSGSLKVPIWTAYELKAREIGDSAPRPKHFRHDYQLNVPSAYDSDFRNSGFSRGHMVPAGDLTWNEEALRDSFLLSNAIPQNLSLNAGKWRMLEGAVRKLAASSDALIVLTGPIFSGTVERIGMNDVAVPSAVFKIVLAIRGGELEMFAVILPNGPNPSRPLSEFATSVEEVQRRTGLDFFQRIPALLQHELEATVSAIAP